MKKTIIIIAFFCFCTLFAFLFINSDQEPSPLLHGDYLIGAHYYMWYPGNFRRYGHLRSKLVPPQMPWMGMYDSDDPALVEQHIAWASKYGIDFFAIDWWPKRPTQNAILEKTFLTSKNIKDIKFCIHYETWGLGFKHGMGMTDFTPEVTKKFIEQILSIADRFFAHQSYLKINGRPVLMLYLTRTFGGQFRLAIDELRQKLKQKGYDVFLLADEIFWRVTPVVPPGKTAFPLTTKPQVQRMDLFDAITSYNMYENKMIPHQGYASESRFLYDVAQKYEEYIWLKSSHVRFIPQIIPGYNDRGVRSDRDHYIIPRQWSPGASEGSFFAEYIDRIGKKYIDPELNMVMITSWNEWHEDTAIEPLKIASSTKYDRSKSKKLYTRGYEYSGYGTKYLEVLSDKFVAISGKVTTADGKPIPDVWVEVVQKKHLKRRKTDSQGNYRFSRLGLRLGNSIASCQLTGDKKNVTIDPHKTATNIDFIR